MHSDTESVALNDIRYFIAEVGAFWKAMIIPFCGRLADVSMRSRVAIEIISEAIAPGIAGHEGAESHDTVATNGSRR